MIRISNIIISMKDASSQEAEKHELRNYILSKLEIKEQELIDFTIFRKSIDARRKSNINYIYTVDVSLEDQDTILNRQQNKGVTLTPQIISQVVKTGKNKNHERPVIIGMGPAGLFAGLMLSQHGYKPIILERGEDVDSRKEKINKFWETGFLDVESNVQFGEGGAGTFSDGKLTTLINDYRCRNVLEEFVKAGAPQEILYKAKPHIGTDLLKATIKNIRHKIISNGGEIRFKAKVTDVIVKDSKISQLVINDKEQLHCNIVLLAIGHSARDTIEMLYNRGVEIKQKAFSIGVRIEHPQEFIDKAQYGDFAGYPGLGAADYKLSYHGKNGRSAYSFCMCPGGYVVAAASEENHLVTNGMSKYNRDGKNANSALLVGVTPADFPNEHPLAGIEFQRKWERAAYEQGGADYNDPARYQNQKFRTGAEPLKFETGGIPLPEPANLPQNLKDGEHSYSRYKAPVQLTGDFLADMPSREWGRVYPTYKPGVVFAELKNCLPFYVTETLKEALVHFDTRIKGFAMADSILTGVETRSSSPVRMIRDSNCLSNIGGLYPTGEGAGYAGGIMSSAVDGIKVAEKIMEEFSPI